MRLSRECFGEGVEFECFDNPLSEMVATDILAGRTYPRIDAATAVRTVLDVGANVGAAAVWFSLAYPGATVHALEPAREPFALLERNTTGRPNIVVHAAGLFSADRSASLHHGALDTVTASVGASRLTRGDAETVQLRSVADWLRENSIDVVDVLKLDTEGCEIPILEGMRDQLGSVQVLHVEFHSDADRKAIDRLVGATHMLVSGHIHHAHRGELTYVANAIASNPEFARHEIRVDL